MNTPTQLVFDLTPMAGAQAAAALGIQRAADRAERVAPGWAAEALDALRHFARQQAEPFTIEAARTAMNLQAPTDGRAFGAVTQAAIRRGVIVATGTYASAASSHGSPKPQYIAGPSA